jgi:hypothetical protein
LVGAEGVELFEGDEEVPPLGELAAGQVLYEPHGALIRAGCLATLCRRLGAHLFDPQIAYLVGEGGEGKRPRDLGGPGDGGGGPGGDEGVGDGGSWDGGSGGGGGRQGERVVQAFGVEEVHPFGLKLLNRRLEALGVARVELKKRGFPVEPESLRPRLKLQHRGRDAAVIFSRIGDQRIMIIGRRLEAL